MQKIFSANQLIEADYHFCREAQRERAPQSGSRVGRVFLYLFIFLALSFPVFY